MSYQQSQQTQSNLERFVRLVNSYEGRDKFTKIIAYSTRFLTSLERLNLKQSNFEKIQSLSIACSDARRFFRLLKFGSEAQYAWELIKKPSLLSDKFDEGEEKQIDEFKRLMLVLIRCAYFFYYLFDNIYILTARDCITYSRSPSVLLKRAMRFWLLGLVLRLYLQLRNIMRIHFSEITVRKQIYSTRHEQNQLQLEIILSHIKLRKHHHFLSLLRTIGDLMPSLYGSNLLNIPEPLAAAGGCLSALAACYQHF